MKDLRLFVDANIILPEPQPPSEFCIETDEQWGESNTHEGH